MRVKVSKLAWVVQLAVAVGIVLLYLVVVTRARPMDWLGG